METLTILLQIYSWINTSWKDHPTVSSYLGDRRHCLSYSQLHGDLFQITSSEQGSQHPCPRKSNFSVLWKDTGLCEGL